MKKLLGLLFFLALFSTLSLAQQDESTQLKLGLGYPELYTYELEHRIGDANSLYASYSGIKYRKSEEEISIYGFNLGKYYDSYIVTPPSAKAVGKLAIQNFHSWIEHDIDKISPNYVKNYNL